MRRAALAALPLLLLSAAAAALDVPFLSGRVNDEARLLDAGSSTALETALRDYETRTGRQIAVLTIPSLAGEDLEGYSLKVARTWKLGRKGKDDGVLILVARDDHKVRIEVGYGLEGALPDALAGRIIRDVMVPRFRGGRFADGVREGADAVIAALEGRLPSSHASGHRRLFLAMDVLTSLDYLCLLFGFRVLFGDWTEIETAGTDLNVLFGGAILISVSFLPLAKFWGLAAVEAVLLFHVLFFLIGKMVMNGTKWGRRRLRKRTGPHRHDAIFYSGVSSSSSGGGGFSGGGGGFSGGGGSFGGGGASGSW